MQVRRNALLTLGKDPATDLSESEHEGVYESDIRLGCGAGGARQYEAAAGIVHAIISYVQT